jgi:hypothetical protein
MNELTSMGAQPIGLTGEALIDAILEFLLHPTDD